MSLCTKVTGERSELNSEIIVMQEAWTKLKQEIDSLKYQVCDTSKIFDVLQSIMNRESLDVTISTILKSGHHSSSSTRTLLQIAAETRVPSRIPSKVGH